MIITLSEILISTVQSAVAELRKISESDASVKPAPNKWSKKEILGHLIDSAANNHQRFVRAQETEVLIDPGYKQDYWVSVQNYNIKLWDSIINLWSNYNYHLAFIIERIPEEKLKNFIKIGEREAHTLEYVIEDYVRHLHHHLKQIGIE